MGAAGGELFEQLSAKGHYRERDAANIMRTLLQVCKHAALHVCASNISTILATIGVDCCIFLAVPAQHSLQSC